MKSPAPTARPAQNKKIDINFNGGKLTSDAGVLLLQQVDQKLRLTEQINALIRDPRDPLLVAHQQEHLLAQRIYSIALGYEDVYCARGDMENRIKEQQMLFADRTSCHGFVANRFRLFLSSCAYVLMETLRRTALFGTEMAKAQCNTIRVKLFKVAAVVTESIRRIVFSLSKVYPMGDLWLRVYNRLQPGYTAPSG
jgi:hypothetical protein